MSSSSAASASPASASPAQSPYQDQLTTFCRNNGLRTPTWQVMSDRRGGRTAWSCTVSIQGQPTPARFWYDGQYVNNAREDAAQMALQRLGQVPPSGVQPAHLQGQGGGQQGGGNGGAGNGGGNGGGEQRHHHGAISS